jgi:hypothetical protein
MKEKFFKLLTTRDKLLDDLIKIYDEIELFKKQYSETEIDELIVDWILQDKSK